jgi:phosphoribosylanthranilate isomerase
MPIKIKICGITNYDDAKNAVSLGVDALGFIFYQKSPRYIHPAQARKIIERLPPFITKVGVFVDESADAISDAYMQSGIDTIQLHGNETPEFAHQFKCAVVKAFGVKPGFDIAELARYRVAGYLLDTWTDAHGGSGRTFDWKIAEAATSKYDNIILAGGLNALNVREALDNVHPYAVEFNNGVEIKPGQKNQYKMRDAIAAVGAMGK